MSSHRSPPRPVSRRTELIATAANRVEALGLRQGARLLTSREWHGPGDWVDLLLAPLVVGGSIVLVRNSADLERRRVQERATVVV